LCPPTPPTRPTSLLETFFLLVPSDESGFEREAFCYVPEVHREFLAAPDSISVVDFRNKVSSSGNGAGFAASSHRGATSKGAKVSNLYEYFKYISLTVPDNFGSLPSSYASRVHKTL
jgi:hypothetical protein